MWRPEGWLVFGLMTPYALERRNNNRTRHSVLYRLHGVIHILCVKAIVYNNSRALTDGMERSRRELEKTVLFADATISGLAPPALSRGFSGEGLRWICY
jgi:hypothetical protein